MTCPQCQSENREGRRFCARCGVSLAVVCPFCGFSNELGERFCGGCGVPQGEPTATARDGGAGSDAAEPVNKNETVGS